ncbi:MAG: hypothetical protein M3R00_06745, partial [Pseudomonadota bacterium]|nr:hypothetical protein [Pseudomonadota bacterium]
EAYQLKEVKRVNDLLNKSQSHRPAPPPPETAPYSANSKSEKAPSQPKPLSTEIREALLSKARKAKEEKSQTSKPSEPRGSKNN